MVLTLVFPLLVLIIVFPRFGSRHSSILVTWSLSIYQCLGFVRHFEYIRAKPIDTDFGPSEPTLLLTVSGSEAAFQVERKTFYPFWGQKATELVWTKKKIIIRLISNLCELEWTGGSDSSNAPQQLPFVRKTQCYK